MKIEGLMPEMIAGLDGKKKTNAAASADAFSRILTDAMSDTKTAVQQAENLTIAAANGENVAMHDVIQAVGKAELTLQTMLTVRDKTVEAYQEVLRMPI